jgi:AraC-like DNA-binding protein
VLFCGYFQFAPAQRVHPTCVHSRMLLWCRAGRGVVRIDGSGWIDMSPDGVLLTPWQHDIEYRADARDPFLLVGVHIVPRYTHRGPHTWRVSHTPGDGFERLPGRADAPLGHALAGIPKASSTGGEPLRLAAEYVMAAFARGDDATRRIEDARVWADLVLRELHAAVTSGAGSRSPSDGSIPAELRRLIVFIDTHVERIDGIDRLAEFAQVSRSTVERMFRRHLHVSPLQFVTERRVRMAKTMLKTSPLSDADVGRRVGIDDAFYFSKLFRANVGRSPREYRRTAARVFI